MGLIIFFFKMADAIEELDHFCTLDWLSEIVQYGFAKRFHK
jgi:hypothetical protein